MKYKILTQRTEITFFMNNLTPPLTRNRSITITHLDINWVRIWRKLLSYVQFLFRNKALKTLKPSSMPYCKTSKHETLVQQLFSVFVRITFRDTATYQKQNSAM